MNTFVRRLMLPICALMLLPAYGQQLPVDASTITPYVTGLNGPRGLAFSPDGALYVAEAGTGGTNSTGSACTQVVPPVGPYKGGPTAVIAKVVNGEVSTIASGFPSTIASTGDLSGVADVTFLNGQLYALLAGGGCSHGNPSLPNGVVRVDLSSGKWQYVTNLSTVLAQNPAAYPSKNDTEPDGEWYTMVAEGGELYVSEPNHAQIYKVATDGAAGVEYDFSFPFADVTPTALAFREGNLYVGNLNIFPIRTEAARITTLSRYLLFFDTTPGLQSTLADVGKLRLAGSRAGFTSIVSAKFGPDGLLYVLELSDADGYPAAGKGKVVRLNQLGVIEDVVTGLTGPTGMVFGPDSALYVSNFGAAPAGTGQVLRIPY